MGEFIRIHPGFFVLLAGTALLFFARLIPSWRVILIVCALVEAVLAGRYWILYFKKKQS